MDHDQRIKRKASAKLTLGPSVIAMGITLQVLATAAHNLVPKVMIIGSSIFVIIVGIVISVMAIARAKRAARKMK